MRFPGFNRRGSDLDDELMAIGADEEAILRARKSALSETDSKKKTQRSLSSKLLGLSNAGEGELTNDKETSSTQVALTKSKSERLPRRASGVFWKSKTPVELPQEDLEGDRRVDEVEEKSSTNFFRLPSLRKQVKPL
jgi:hypothetical protein